MKRNWFSNFELQVMELNERFNEFEKLSEDFADVVKRLTVNLQENSRVNYESFRPAQENQNFKKVKDKEIL